MFYYFTELILTQTAKIVIFYIRFIILIYFLLITASAQASVFEFNKDGSVIKYEASDYLSRIRHQKLLLEPGFTTPQSLYDNFIAKAATKHDVDAALIRAVIFVESGYQPKAISPKGAEGLMQLMPETAKQYGVKDTFDPEQNIQGGTQYLQDLLNKYEGNISLALAAYNAGENAVTKYNGIPPYQETINYIEKVINLYRQD